MKSLVFILSVVAGLIMGTAYAEGSKAQGSAEATEADLNALRESETAPQEQSAEETAEGEAAADTQDS